ncbi:hypothetical protein [Gordonibacter urolithinfaciens]|uniref:hypothetical protein n=1 Tax=Gordonibacter urolithinfaciens TaxID=1335613 RepID=UPI003AAB8847
MDVLSENIDQFLAWVRDEPVQFYTLLALAAVICFCILLIASAIKRSETAKSRREEASKQAEEIREIKKMLEDYSKPAAQPDLSKIDGAIKTSVERLNAILESSKAQYERIKDLADETAVRSAAVADINLFYEYSEYSHSQRIISVIYDISAFLFGLISILFFMAFVQADPAGNASVVVMKLALMLAMLSVSGCLFRRGTFHKRESKAAARTALTISQYKPFIAPLPDERQTEIIDGIAKRLFVQGDMDHSEERLADLIGRKGVDLPALVELLKLVNGKDS